MNKQTNINFLPSTIVQIGLIILIFLAMPKINAQIRVGISYNVDLYKPYTALAKEYQKENNNIHSQTANLNLSYPVLKKEKWTWETGLSYKFIRHVVDKKIEYYYDTYFKKAQNTEIETYYVLVHNPLDLISKSHSVGIVNSLNFKWKQREKHLQELGLQSEIYFFEYFKAAYYTQNHKNYNDHKSSASPYLSPSYDINPKLFFLNCVNLSAFYRHSWVRTDKNPLAAKISLGTNLYSDWDQFKKYLWLGVGFEIGFGKRSKTE